MGDPSARERAGWARSDPGLAVDRRLLGEAVVAAGTPGAPAVILLHATRRTRAMWRHQLDGLADRFHVLAVDLPGHGSLAHLPFRLGDASALAAAVIEDLPGGSAVVVGVSLGGYVGMDLAARRPGLVAGLVISNATAEPRYIASHAPRTVGAYLVSAAGERLRTRLAHGLHHEAGVHHGHGHDGHDGHDGHGGHDGHDGGHDGHDGGHDGHDGGHRRARGPAGGGRSDPAEPTQGWLFKGGSRALVSALRESFLPRIAAYPGPTLILNGADDALFRSSERAFLDAASAGRIEVIPGAGHEVNEEQPEQFNAAVARFAVEAQGRVGAGGTG